MVSVLHLRLLQVCQGAHAMIKYTTKVLLPQILALKYKELALWLSFATWVFVARNGLVCELRSQAPYLPGIGWPGLTPAFLSPPPNSDTAAPSQKLRRSIQGVGWSDWWAEICSDPETCSSPCLFSVTYSCHLDFSPYSLLTGCYYHFCTFSCSCYYCLCTLHWYSCLQPQEQRF